MLNLNNSDLALRLHISARRRQLQAITITPLTGTIFQHKMAKHQYYNPPKTKPEEANTKITKSIIIISIISKISIIVINNNYYP